MVDFNKFRFVSPGVFLDEIDNSRLPATPDPVGPVVIGRTEKGPGLKPTKISSFLEFTSVFGNPIAGGKGGDVWRDGNYTSPTYASFASQAWLKNSSPVTVVRLLGSQHPQATTAGAAGWQTTNGPGATLNSAGGAFGLFVFPSGSTQNNATGTLAAVWYVDAGAVKLRGKPHGSGSATHGSQLIVASSGADFEFEAVVVNGSNATQLSASFNFNEDSSKYIRKVFNTNPTATNSTINSTTKNYFLGETNERSLYDICGTSAAAATAASAFAFVCPIESGHSFRTAAKASQTGWVISQDLSSDVASSPPRSMDTLFSLVSLHDGEDLQKSVKISISDIKESVNPSVDPYGSFTVSLRSVDNTDARPSSLEVFTKSNLNPNSNNFIAKKIGDKYRTWDTTNLRYQEYGNYDNKSKFVYVELSDAVLKGNANPQLLPYGFLGPARHSTVTISSANIPGAGPIGELATTAATVKEGRANQSTDLQGLNGSNYGTIKIEFPKIPLRVSSSDGGLSDHERAHFGLDTAYVRSSRNENRFDKSVLETLRLSPTAYDSIDGTAANRAYQVEFSLDDLRRAQTTAGSDTSHAVWESGNRAGNRSMTAKSGSSFVLDQGFDKFTLPLFGGFDGLDIKERDPFRNTKLSSGDEKTNYAIYSLRKAIDSIADSEVVEMNAVTIPGITNTAITDKLIATCEDRADALAIVDLEGGYQSEHEGTSGESDRLGSVSSVVSNLKTRGINSSYACSFHPWVQTVSQADGTMLWIPPSVAALGTFSSTDRQSAPWFAPAGFTRGGLTEGAAGISVVGVRQQLSKKERDKLYERNVNPIAKFPSEGIVVFGQKTLQVTPSALDRINVRRLLIHVKRGISRIASRLLFTPNVNATWQRFINEANPFLEEIKSQFGLEDFRVVLDKSTTTPDLVDRNVMYAKVLLKPTKSIEFIAIDFVIQRSGASFDD